MNVELYEKCVRYFSLYDFKTGYCIWFKTILPSGWGSLMWEPGTGVITTMSANTNINIIALADIFDDKLMLAKKALNKRNANKGFADIQKGNIFQGSNAYLKLLENRM